MDGIDLIYVDDEWGGVYCERPADYVGDTKDRTLAPHYFTAVECRRSSRASRQASSTDSAVSSSDGRSVVTTNLIGQLHE
ncbi:hypothetical protein GCM10027598_28020 [Amycolatopsis oliviviridis]|uniref:Uncharacterized protein n=1 Tax=Amycolatopsis oliviviridis TaxID=1471590 RepID=A0ABQ3LJS3_9PSEU|nr:hypothetical protein GCM10017790_35670 [Amycolatopsis oliviviridis]